MVRTRPDRSSEAAKICEATGKLPFAKPCPVARLPSDDESKGGWIDAVVRLIINGWVATHSGSGARAIEEARQGSCVKKCFLRINLLFRV